MKKVFFGVTAIFLTVLTGFLAYAVATATKSDHPVGLTLTQIKTSQGPMALAIWYPTTSAPRPTTFLGGHLLKVARDGNVAGTSLPVLLISHGNGGSYVSQVDTAMAFASAGYVVAAPMHVGDNFMDQSAASSPTVFQDRAGQVKASLDYVLSDWSGHGHVDGNRIGAFGMSAGGFTILNLIGGAAHLSLIPAECKAHPEFICEALHQVHSPLLVSGQPHVPFPRDPRIKAAAVAAPGLGFTFAPGSLSKVTIPVQVWYGTADTTVPYASNARIVAEGLAHAEVHPVRAATHFSFLAPCGLLNPPTFCKDPVGFDRVAAHRLMNAAMVDFFDRNLR